MNRDFDLFSKQDIVDQPVKHKKRAAKAQPVNKAYNIKNSTKKTKSLLQLPKSTNVTTLSERNLNTGQKVN